MPEIETEAQEVERQCGGCLDVDAVTADRE